MQPELFFALFGFAAVTLFSPGPNNLMLMASGTNFGYRPSLRHLFGVVLGFGSMNLLVGIGLMGLFQAVPQLQTVLKYVSVVYLTWLAWKIAHAAPPEARAAEGAKPLTFLQAAAFQWVNPKAWTMALSAMAAYAPDQSFLAVAIVALTFTGVGYFSANTWLLLGREIRRVLTNRRRLTLFNWAMATLLVASLIPVLFH